MKFIYIKKFSSN